uniref:Uncharacterized protein n=1 Tax=Oreochromis aureus TaxID=47969 RepID=A0AAZ1XWE7_OREAU
MDQCEDRERSPSSKSTLCGEHESQTKAQRNQQGTKRKHEPEPSCVSLRSDQSKGHIINFKVQPVSAAERLTEVQKKMMMEEEEDRAESAGSSCPSVRSDWSKDLPPLFSGEPGPTRGQRSQSAGSSCPSVRSDRSKGYNPNFSAEPGPTRVDQQSSEVPSGQSAQQHQTQLDSIFMLLEDIIITFVKNELKKIQKVLSPDYPECLESQRSSSREAFVKIAVDFLRTMKQEELADRLQ